MQRGYSFDITNVIDNDNLLEVELLPINEQLTEHNNDKYVSVFDNDRLFLRKAQCHFGWDWAPQFGGYGIFRSVRLEYLDLSDVKNVNVTTSNSGDVTFRVELGNICLGDVSIKIKDKQGKMVSEYSSQNLRFKKKLFNLKVENPELWYPLGYGDQPIYSYEITFTDDLGDHTKVGTFAFREIKVNTTPLSNEKLDFCLEVNGKRVFCRGSNWVPAECMTGILTDKKYIDLLTLAKDCNFNTLRVWGGGIYESDIFYKTCDEYGILVWQDFMFACSDIPEDNPIFMEKLIEETVWQVQRLQAHPCIALWCGMNEIRGSFCEDDEKYGYNTLHYLFRGIVGDLAGNTPYVRATPYAFADLENSDTEGDCHNNISEPCLFNASFKGFENFNYDDKNLEAGERLKEYYLYLDDTECNFSSECAVLGFVNYSSLLKFTPNESNNLDSEFLTERFRGNPYTFVMPTFFERQKRIAEKLYGKSKDVKELSQKCNKAQADIMLSEILFARVNGRSNGLLTWMYNDIWPTGTWSVVDYYLNTKPAYYTMKRAYKSFIADFIPCHKGVELCIIKDSSTGEKVEYEVGFYSYGGKLLNTAHSSQIVFDRKPIKVKYETNADYVICTAICNNEKASSIFDVNKYNEVNYEKKFDYEIESNIKDGNFDCAKSLKEWLNNICMAQNESGALPGIVPTGGWGYAWGNGPAWDSVLIELPYQIYKFTNDVEVIRNVSSYIVKYFDYLKTKLNDNGLIAFGLGDWCEAGTFKEEDFKTPLEVTDSLVTIDLVRKSTQLLNVIGKTKEANSIKIFGDSLQNNFRKKYFNDGRCLLDTQTGISLALDLSIVKDNEIKNAYQKLIGLIKKENNHFKVGVLGMKPLLNVLTKYGDVDLALKLIIQPSFPSYAYNVNKGATTLWEAFQELEDNQNKIIRKDGGSRILSFNHHFWGMISAWFYKKIAGIDLQFNNQVEISPNFISELNWARGSYENNGKYVYTYWCREDENIILKVNSKGYKCKLTLNDWRIEGGISKLDILEGEQEYVLYRN